MLCVQLHHRSSFWIATTSLGTKRGEGQIDCHQVNSFLGWLIYEWETNIVFERAHQHDMKELKLSVCDGLYCTSERKIELLLRSIRATILRGLKGTQDITAPPEKTNRSISDTAFHTCWTGHTIRGMSCFLNFEVCCIIPSTLYAVVRIDLNHRKTFPYLLHLFECIPLW